VAEGAAVPPSSPPDAAVLIALDADRWAALLPYIRAALMDMDDERLGERGEALRAAPTGRLAGGAGRRDLCELVVAPDIWNAIRAEVLAIDPVPDGVAWIVAGSPVTTDPAPAPAPLATSRAAADDRGRQRARRDRERLKTAREERDAARRRADGAEARADAAVRDLDAARDELQALRQQIGELEQRVLDADGDRTRAVDRERRRRDAEVADLREQLAALRRAEEHRRGAERRRADELQAAAQRSTADPRRDSEPDVAVEAPGGGTRIVPGRPSRLPAGVAPGTTEALDLLLHRDRLVLVDGYNVTLKHRKEFGLEQQRTWLIQALANLARQRGVRPTVVFDGVAVGGQQRSGGGREVTVRFSGADITADDEIVLELESTDEPALVVTNDRELTQRCQRSGADVVPADQFVWVLR
jgi:predicted RNA-binding protein with PIN domain